MDRARGRWARRLAIVMTAALLAGPGAAPGARATIAPSPDCGVAGRGSVAIADQIMAGVLVLSPHPAYRIPIDPTWREDVARGRQWGFQYHSLRWVNTLLNAWRTTGVESYRSRAAALLRDWHRTNVPSRSPSSMAWNDHSTAWRAGVYACAVQALGRPAWLLDAIRRHGTMLADPGFYVYRGNHALNQAIGLLDVGIVVPRSDWVTLAVKRIARVIETDVDSQGANAEGAVEYQGYIYSRAVVARGRIRAAGRAVPAVLSRVDLMPTFLAYASLPDGTLETLGDTEVKPVPRIAGTVAEFASTLGARGPKPAGIHAVYRQGYVFGRTGWGERRPYRDEVAYSIRFGRAPWTVHQHYDGGSLTLYGYGAPLLVDPGKYTYDGGSWRTWFRSRQAHNVVTVDGVAPRGTYGTTFAMSSSATMRLYRTRTATYPGTTLDRAIVWSTGGEYILVEDRATSTVSRTLTQRWHLAPGSAPSRSTTAAWTGRARGNLLVRQLAGGTMRIVSGATSPIQGWYSPRYGRRVPAPVVETRRSGRSVRFLTLLVPSATSRPAVAVAGLRLLADGFDVRISVNGRTERVILRSTGATVTVISAPPPTPTPTPTPVPTPTPEVTPEPTPTPEVTPEPTPTPAPTPTPEVTPEPAPTPMPEATPEVTPEPPTPVMPDVAPDPTPSPSADRSEPAAPPALAVRATGPIVRVRRPRRHHATRRVGAHRGSTV